MKRLTYLLIVAVLALSWGGCKKFLNTKPTDTLTPEEYYGSESKLTAALAGVYDPLGNENGMYGSSMFADFDYSDESWGGNSNTTSGLQVYNFDFTAPRIGDLWRNCYIGIDRANRIIANINIASMDSTAREAILGEALFLRGFYYFTLVTRFGAVPMRLEPISSPADAQLPRTPVTEIYAQILIDMKAAETKVFPMYATASRVYKTVVQGMLARVCLHMAGYPLNDQSKYAEALAWAKKVKSTNQHALNMYVDPKYVNFDPRFTNTSPFSQIFINHAQDLYDVKESMWEVEFKGNRADGFNENGRIGNNIGIVFQPGAGTALEKDSGFCWGTVKATGVLYNLYGTRDTLRRDWAIGNHSINNTTGVKTLLLANNRYGRYPAKWRRSFELLTPKNKNYTPINFPLLRYADVLLMLAEAENQVNGPTAEAYEAVNMVRRRAFNVPLSAPNVNADAPAGLDKASFQQFIEDERARELCFESLRRLDLIRWNKFVSRMKEVSADFTANGGGNAYGSLAGRNVDQRHLLYPIPAAEILLNKKLSQNPGW
jgi:hypothetical protein